MGLEDVFILGFSCSFKDILVKNSLKCGKNPVNFSGLGRFLFQKV